VSDSDKELSTVEMVIMHTGGTVKSFSDDTMHSNMLSGIRDSRFLKATKSIGIGAAF
jgi:hypothetical protein